MAALTAPWQWWRSAALLLWMGGLTCSPLTLAQPSSVRMLEVARAELSPDERPSQAREVRLPLRWDQEFPGVGGQARFEIDLPASALAGDTPMAVLLENTGNQVVVSRGGRVLARLGRLGDPLHDATKSAHLIAVPDPSPLATEAQTAPLVIQVTMQRQRGAGLGAILYGPEAAISEIQRARQPWQHTSATVYAVGLLLMGSLAAGLWWRQRDPLYGCFSLAAFAGAVRNVDRAWSDVPVPWPYWGAVVAICYAMQIGLIGRFVLLVLNRQPAWLVRSLYTAMAVSVPMALLSFALALPVLWTGSLIVLQLSATACLPIVISEAQRDRSTVVWCLLVAGALAIAAGAHDLLRVRMGLLGGSSFTLTPHAMFVFVLILGGLVVERYSRTVKDYMTLSTNLKDQLEDREIQLREMFDALRVQQQEQAILLERQRMMREIHDGVGSQLVGLLNIVMHPTPDPALLETHVKVALDEMRMAIDSLQPAHDDLGAVLATLRYRLQARIDAALIELSWDVEGLPENVPVSAQEALQLQRILLEAFTNVLKHAQAHRIVLRATGKTDTKGQVLQVRISLSDDGSGGRQRDADAVQFGGLGLASMKARALAIGATVQIEQRAGAGTQVVVNWVPSSRQAIGSALQSQSVH